MHLDRNQGKWPELKAKRHNKFDDAPLDGINVTHGHLDNGSQDFQKTKKDRAAKQLSRVKAMFKDMAEYSNKQDK